METPQSSTDEARITEVALDLSHPMIDADGDRPLPNAEKLASARRIRRPRSNTAGSLGGCTSHRQSTERGW